MVYRLTENNKMSQSPISSLRASTLTAKRPLLTLSIPTYKRPDQLKCFLENHDFLMGRSDLEIFILDNDQSQDARKLCSQFISSNLNYVQNPRNIEEGSFIKALTLGQGRYVWIVGDSYALNQQALERILAALRDDESISLLLLNGENRITDVSDTTFHDVNDTLSEVGWHLTNICSVIYNRDQYFSIPETVHYRFPHFSVCVSRMMSPFTAKWISIPCFGGGKLITQKKSWESIAEIVWLKDWPNFVNTLPSQITNATRNTLLRSHATRSGVFNAYNCIRYRCSGGLAPETLFGMKKELMHLATSSITAFLILVLAATLPKTICTTVIHFYNTLRLAVR